MHYEVERKFRVANPADLEGRLAELGAEFDPPEWQVDCYYAHPTRDFAATDEALRIRRVGDANFVTYKGPKLDQLTKTRREIEVPLADGEQPAADFGNLLVALGFRLVAEVYKQRRRAELPWQGRSVEVALDQVERLGHFVELELRADDGELEGARQSIASLAARLGLAHGERRSYLELLLDPKVPGAFGRH